MGFKFDTMPDTEDPVQLPDWGTIARHSATVDAPHLRASLCSRHGGIEEGVTQAGSGGDEKML
jgi:hypothetical protein